MKYINPFYLFEAFGIPRPESSKSLRSAKKRLLQEFDLSDHQSLAFEGRTYFKNDVVTFLEELEDPIVFGYHQVIFEQRQLCEFLMGFGYAGRLPTQDEIRRGGDGLLAFISPSFADVYGESLLEAVKANNPSRIKSVLEMPLLCLKEDLESCYLSSHAHIETAIISELKAIEDKFDNGGFNSTEFPGLLKRLSLVAQPSSLNLLPAYFQEQRNKITERLRGIAISLQRLNIEDIDWVQVLKLAGSLTSDGMLQSRLKAELSKAISEREDWAREISIDIEFGFWIFKKHFKITPAGIFLGKNHAFGLSDLVTESRTFFPLNNMVPRCLVWVM